MKSGSDRLPTAARLFALVFLAALACSGCDYRIGTALPYADCEVYRNPIRLPQDAEGWTVFAPSADSRILYVSAATGNDATGRAYGRGDAELGGYPLDPSGSILAFASYDAARALSREGFPDWILFRRGEAYDGVSVELRSGRGETEYSLVGAYGAGAPPELHPRPDWPVIRASNRGNLQYAAAIDLDCYDPLHDPANYPPGTMPPESGTGIDGTDGDGVTRKILIENVSFRCFSGNVMQAYGGGAMRDIAFRRSIFLDNHRGDRANGHSQGLYAAQVRGFWLEGCVFDHNGWHNRDDGNPATELPGEATMFNHNTYFADCRDVAFRDNLFLRPSSMGNKFTANLGLAGSSPNIALQGNLYFDGEIGIGLGGNVPTPHKFKGVLVEGNVFTEIGRSRPTNGTLGWGLEIQDWDGGVARDNLFIHNPHADVDNTYAIAVVGGTKNVLITDNVIYGQNEAGNNRWGLGLTVDAAFEKENIKVSGNLFQEPAAGCVFARIEEPRLAAALDFRANRFWAQGEAGRGASFQVGNELLSYEEWTSRIGGSSAFGPVSLPDPARDIAAYQAGPGGGGGIEEFIAACRARRKGAWRAAHDARAVIAWLRSGFGRY